MGLSRLEGNSSKAVRSSNTREATRSVVSMLTSCIQFRGEGDVARTPTSVTFDPVQIAMFRTAL